MNDPLTAILNHVPENFRGWATFAAVCLPFLTRSYHALISGGGLRGVWGAIWFGTNTPTAAPVKISVEGSSSSRSSSAGPFLSLVLTAGLALGLVACANLDRNVYQAENLAADTVQAARHTFNVWYQAQLQEAITAGNTNRVVELHGMRDRVRQEVHQIAVGLSTVDTLRLEVMTNSANTNLTALQIAEATLPEASSNLVLTVQYFMTGRATVIAH